MSDSVPLQSGYLPGTQPTVGGEGEEPRARFRQTSQGQRVEEFGLGRHGKAEVQATGTGNIRKHTVFVQT